MHFCSTAHKALWQTKQRESLGFTREWLAAEYFDKGKSTYQIAKEIGRDSKRVWEWMRDYGMNVRPRGTDYGQAFKKGMVSPFIGRKHTDETKEKLSRIAKADGRVPYDPEVGSYMKGRKGADTPNWKGGATPERQAFYCSKEWADAVKAVWKRDEAICQRCGKNHNVAESRGTFHIHHIVSFMVARLRAKVSNLVLLCNECHRFVHSKKNTHKSFIGGE